jgi:hypothetical protein
MVSEGLRLGIDCVQGIFNARPLSYIGLVRRANKKSMPKAGHHLMAETHLKIRPTKPNQAGCGDWP